MKPIKNPGPIYVLLAAVLWSLAGVCIKYIPWNPISIACMRGVVAAVTIGILRRKWMVTLNRSTILAAICLQLTTLLFMASNKLTTAANAVVLKQTAPVYVIIAILAMQKIKPRALDSITVLLTFSGIALFFLDHLGHGALLGDVLALLSGVSFAGVFFFNSLPDSSPMDACFLGCCMSALLLPALFFDPAVRTGGLEPWLLVLFMGVFQLGLAYLMFAKGIRSTGAVASSIIGTLEPVLNPIFVYIVLGEKPGRLALIGAGLVIGAIAAYNITTSKRQNETAHPA